MKIAVVGTGYVGLVAGACLAESGNDVVCVDNDEAKVRMLRRGKMPFYEPGLEELVRRNREERRLTFSATLPKAVRDSAVIFIAVGTPPGEDGSADVQQVLGSDFRAAVLKGRSHYLCPARLAAMLQSGPVSADEMRVLAKVLLWLPTTVSGDGDELFIPSPGERAVWARLSADNPACTSDRCNSANASATNSSSPVHLFILQAESSTHAICSVGLCVLWPCTQLESQSSSPMQIARDTP